MHAGRMKVRRLRLALQRGKGPECQMPKGIQEGRQRRCVCAPWRKNGTKARRQKALEYLFWMTHSHRRIHRPQTILRSTSWAKTWNHSGTLECKPTSCFPTHTTKPSCKCLQFQLSIHMVLPWPSICLLGRWAPKRSSYSHMSSLRTISMQVAMQTHQVAVDSGPAKFDS